jgi:hypothetical protein
MYSKEVDMKAYFMFTAGGPLVVLTSYDSIVTPELLKRLNSKGINKFIAYEVPIESARDRYGMHYDIVLQDLHESDDFRILDYSGERAFRNFKLNELGRPIYYEEEVVITEEDV